MSTQQQVLATFLAILMLQINFSSILATECKSIDVRNDCYNLVQLKNCTIIKGYLNIVLLPKTNNKVICNYDNFQFPLLREITDYLIFYDVKGLKSIRNLFPNLTVIRGQRLFLNYALGITNMPDLELLEFKSLVAIQHGHVFIGSCPKLCYLEKINWDRLTLSRGENYILPVSSEICPAESDCKNCASGYCWSNTTCEMFENDNMVNTMLGTHTCHEECLGGCYNSTEQGCVVCKGFSDHGTCVKQCPANKYKMEQYHRCYTQEECVKDTKHHTYESSCVKECPSGYMANNSNCVPCAEGYDCTKICPPSEFFDAITVFNLADAENLRGCEILNTSLIITIRNVVDENELLQNFASLKEIRGHLKIFRSPYLTSLKFIHNVRKIHGDPLENDVFAVIIYDNDKLKTLWSPDHLELERGGLYVHRNNKLCNRFLREFRDGIIHDKTLDSFQSSDQEVLCEPAKLTLHIEVASHRCIKISWPKELTSDEVEIAYRRILREETFSEETELDTNVCTRINWHRQLMFKEDIEGNQTHNVYYIENLQSNTKYALLVKTFGGNEKNDARSNMEFATTKLNLPRPPEVSVIQKTDTSLTLKMKPADNITENIVYYMLEVYDMPDDVELIDKRNYCNQPAFLNLDISLDGYTSSNHNEDYEECCTRLEEQQEDKLFMQNMRDQFSCTLDNKHNCFIQSPDVQGEKPLQRLRLELNETTYTVHDLQRYRLYVLQLQSCNDIGCSSYTMHSERTNYSIAGDKLDKVEACRVSDTPEYRIYFTEPKHPNGVIVSYLIYYRMYLPSAKIFKEHIKCITRLQHEQSHYEYIGHLNSTFDQVVVCVTSLAGFIFTPWINVTDCQSKRMTKIAGLAVPDSQHSHGLSIFLIFFLIGAGGTILWICYKRRYWRKISEIQRYIHVNSSWRSLLIRPAASMEDQQILVHEFETVRFHNNSDDDQKYLE